MRRNSVLFTFLTFLLFSCSSAKKEQGASSVEAPQQTANPQHQSLDAQLTEDQYLRLTRGVFEIIIPRVEDKDIVYQEVLPEHLLPFKLRKSPYRGVGTAFAIAPNRFVSAAHVFDLHQPTLVTPAALRDTEGKVYAIDKILRYSQHRDLIEFSLKTPPKFIEPLKIAKTARMGQGVFTVGNALGDGIVTRSGYITSFTPESVDGEWNDIRYSAPASPGNSGGPLLNKNLEVVGVVVRRTQNENLNFGIPIAELEKVKGAQFFLRDVKLEQFSKQLSRDWKFNFPLPADEKAITLAAAKNYLKFQEDIYADFQKKFKNDVFPTDPKLKSWAKDSWSISLAGFIQKDNNENWITLPVDWNIKKLEKYRAIVLEKNAERASTTFFMLERPLNQKLKDFYQDGKGILDTFIKQLGVYRNYMGRKIIVKSYGKPDQTTKLSDAYGRKWIAWEWNTIHDDRTLQLTCMPVPAGVFCLFNTDPYFMKELSRMTTKRALNRFLIDVYGKIRDWDEWNKLPEEWKQPMIPRNVSVEMTKGKDKTLNWRVGQYSGKIQRPEFDDDAEIALSYSSSPENIFKLRLRNIQVAEKDGDIQLGVGTNYRPDEEGSPAYREVWDKMLEQRAPYNGQAQISGKHSLIVSLIGQSAAKAEQLSFTTCGVISSVGEQKIQDICKEYSKSVSVGR